MIRKNILNDAEAATRYYDAVWKLKDPEQSPWPGQEDKGLAIYDFFVFWHHRAMMLLTPPDQARRNAAHSGPVFLPWHRYMLIRLEIFMQDALEDSDFRLPYWDWAHDAESLSDPTTSDIWNDDHLGQFMATEWQIRFDQNSFGDNPFPLVEPREMRRFVGQWAGADMGPKTDLEQLMTSHPVYDETPYNESPLQFRNILEGWEGSHRFHNNVHLFVGGQIGTRPDVTFGDMVLSTSPNDPAFFLHHCNVDRAWASWQAKNPTSPYVPDQNAPDTLRFHRLKDRMYTFFDETVTPKDMLDYQSYYQYDTLYS